MKSSSLLEQVQLEDKLGTALSEHILNTFGDRTGNSELQRHVFLHQVNTLLLTTGPGAEIKPKHFKSAIQLESHLTSFMQLPAQVLMKELPTRTAAWLAVEPHRQSPERPQWAEEGWQLLDQAQRNQNDDE